MTDSIYFQKLAVSFLDTIELPHFNTVSFRVNNKIWATLNATKNTVNFKLSPIDQSVFSTIDTTIIYPVKNKWALQGWTTIELSTINKKLLKQIMAAAYHQAFIKK